MNFIKRNWLKILALLTGIYFLFIKKSHTITSQSVKKSKKTIKKINEELEVLNAKKVNPDYYNNKSKRTD
jgi:uncharacterized membrane protein